MGVVEDFMAAVIVLFIFLIAGLVYLTSFSHDAVINTGVKEDVFFDDMYMNNLNTLLHITEPMSKRPIGTLLADSVYYRNKTVIVDNNEINIINETEKLLNFTFQEGNYYLIVKPRIIEVSMNFIIDGSDSLIDEREKLAQILPGLITKIELKLNSTNAGYKMKVAKNPVIAKIFILHREPKVCDIFDNINDSRITCTILDEKKLYMKNSSNSSSLFINNSRFNNNAFLSYYNMTPPFGFSWVENNLTNLKPADYADSDWGYGTAYASNFDVKTSLSKLTLLFPMSDELSTSSFPDECFSYTDWPTARYCTLCVSNCPVNRSMQSIQKGILVARDNNHIINPIFSYSCNYVYKDDYNVLYELITGNSTTNACTEAGCGGCSVDKNGGVCFQPKCSIDNLAQMNIMANQTGGEVINLDNITNMDINIINTINNNIEQYKIEIGHRDDEKQRQVVEMTWPMPNDEFVDIRLWIYKSKTTSII